LLLSKNKIPFKIGPGTDLHEFLYPINEDAPDEMPWHLSKLSHLLNRYDGYIYCSVILPIASLRITNKKARLRDS
jgi:hypothetical protein